MDTIWGDNQTGLGAPADDVIYGDVQGGNNGSGDYIDGGGGKDEIHGGEGNDVIHGGDGPDVIHGDDGDDEIYGGDEDPGDCSVSGTIDGECGDKIAGGLDDDIIVGGDGNDVAYGGYMGQTGNSQGQGNDQFYMGDDDDLAYGGAGTDKLFGGRGDDRLMGGDGVDTLYGYWGADFLWGGPQSDQFCESDDNDSGDTLGGAMQTIRGDGSTNTSTTDTLYYLGQSLSNPTVNDGTGTVDILRYCLVDTDDFDDVLTASPSMLQQCALPASCTSLEAGP